MKAGKAEMERALENCRKYLCRHDAVMAFLHKSMAREQEYRAEWQGLKNSLTARLQLMKIKAKKRKR